MVIILNRIFLKRIYAIKLLCYILLICMCLRLYNLMIVRHREISLLASETNTVSLSVTTDRNDICDRHMRKLTGVNLSDYAVIFPSGNNDNDFECCRFVACFSDTDEYKLYNDLRKYGKVYTPVTKSEEFQKKNKFPNAKIITLNTRYPQSSPLCSVVGYLSDLKGVSGLEKLYDEILSDTDLKIRGMADAKMTYVPGGDVSLYNSRARKFVKTTLDLEYSSYCFDALKNAGVKGAAVLLDVETFDVLAMVSMPGFDQNNVGDFLNSSDGNLSNRCLMNYDLGSIFKIVVACSAMENKSAEKNDIYYCNGVRTVSGKDIKCHNLSGHQWVDMENAFMQSCNPAFIDIGLKTGYENIIDMAKKFGFGEKILYPQDFVQSTGTLPSVKKNNKIDLANISIGQGTLNGNVVQGAVLSAVIASGGIKRNVNMVDCIVSETGEVIEKVRNDKSERIISEETARKVYNMMIKTNLAGTGTTGFIDYYGSGGKTGSAQTGWSVDGELYQHGWYTGFFPADNPKFALCVFVENGKSGSESACPIFKEIGEKVLSQK